jgi:hypothetical protein
MLDKKIRKALIESKEKKEKVLIEEQIVKDRILFLFEGIKSKKEFKKLPKEKQLRMSVRFIQEISFLQTNGLINEQTMDWGGFLKDVFGMAFGSVAQTMVEPFIEDILNKLGITGLIRNSIVSYLTSRPSEIIKSFSDCKLMTKLLSRSIVEGMVMSLQDKTGTKGFAYNLVRNQLANMIESTEFVSSIESGLQTMVCSLVSKLGKNTKDLLGKLKGNVSSSLTS